MLVETLSNLGTDKTRDRLEAAGFNDVTILVAGRPEPPPPALPPPPPTLPPPQRSFSSSAPAKRGRGTTRRGVVGGVLRTISLHLSPLRGESVGVLRTPFLSKNADTEDRLCAARVRGLTAILSAALPRPAERPPHPHLLPARGGKVRSAFHGKPANNSVVPHHIGNDATGELNMAAHLPPTAKPQDQADELMRLAPLLQNLAASRRGNCSHRFLPRCRHLS